MNLIQEQAKEFLSRNFTEGDDAKEFVQSVRSELLEYRKVSHQLVFIDEILVRIKRKADAHSEVCTYSGKGKCPKNFSFENILFFLQNERDELIELIPVTDYTPFERDQISNSLQQILSELQTVKDGQEITYDDLSNAINELKENYFLGKKTFTQLMTGKLAEMVASGVIGETVSKEIVQVVSRHYSELIR
jgi:hypothetical protein